MFKKAEKKKQKLRLLIEGPSGAGKTLTSLILAKGLGGKVAVLDTENGSASLYADMFEFDTVVLEPPYTPERYIETIKEAEKLGYDILIIDSISHEWSGTGGCLDVHSLMTGNSFQNWTKVTPRHRKFCDEILRTDLHIIATARTKTDYAITENEKGQKVPVKLGMKTEQRDGLEYEFTTVLRLNDQHVASASKDRTGIFANKEEVLTEQTGGMLQEWLNSGVELLATKEQKKVLVSIMKDLGIESNGMTAFLKELYSDNEEEKQQFDPERMTLDDLKLLRTKLQNEVEAKEQGITVSQVNEFYSISKKNGWNTKEANEELLNKFNITSASNIPNSQYAEICSYFSTNKPEFALQGESK